MRYLFWLLMGFILVTGQPAAAQEQQPEAARAIVTALNTWRISNNLWPLKVNPTLEQMAVDQAAYLLTLPEMPDGSAIHVGRNGESPQYRARIGYGWEDYGDASRTAITEIAYVGASPSAAIRFWEGSAVHRTASLSETYREIGVAALPHRFGYVYIVVFGSRPNVLPALADMNSRRLYLTDERYRYAAAKDDAISSVTRVRLFDADGRAISEWQSWQSVLALPSSTGEQVIIEYTDGEHTSLAVAPISAEITAQLPQLPTPTPTNPPTLTPLPTFTPLPSLTPRVSSTPAPTTAVSTPVASAPEDGDLLAISAVVSDQPPNVALIYDNRTLVVQNIGSTRLNLRDLIFVTDAMSFSIHRWQTQWMSGTLDDFPASDCLQAWSWTEASSLETPPICRQRRSVITLPPEQMFWRGDFNVYWHAGQQVVANCTASAARCEFFIDAVP